MERLLLARLLILRRFLLVELAFERGRGRDDVRRDGGGDGGGGAGGAGVSGTWLSFCECDEYSKRDSVVCLLDFSAEPWECSAALMAACTAIGRSSKKISKRISNCRALIEFDVNRSSKSGSSLLSRRWLIKGKLKIEEMSGRFCRTNVCAVPINNALYTLVA